MVQIGLGARNVVKSGGLLREAGRLLTRHWPALVALSAGGLFLREYVLDAAVALAPHTGVGGILMVAVTPLVAMLVTVAMLLVLQRSITGDAASFRVVVAAVGSMIVPFLVVYENFGNMSEDWSAYVLGIRDAAAEQAFVAGLNGQTTDGEAWLPEGTSILVISIVAGALLTRAVATKMAVRLNGQQLSLAARRTGLQALSAYADVVWVVLGIAVVTVATDRVKGWWSDRIAARWLGDTWERVTLDVPLLSDIADVVGLMTGYLVDGLLVGVVVPISWLAFGLIVYGTQAADVLRLPEDGGGVAARLLRRMRTRLGTAAVDKAWQLSLDPELRFGPLIGGLGMIRRSAWGASLLFCLAYTVASESGRVVWALARWIVGPDTFTVWASLEPALDAVSSIVVQVLTVCLLAAAAGGLIRGFGRASADVPQSAGSRQ